MFASKVASPQKNPAQTAAPKAVPSHAAQTAAYDSPARSRSARGWEFGNVLVFPPGRAGAVDPESGLEQEARSIARQAVESGESHPLLSEGLAQARIHAGGEPARRAAQQDALAYTVGRDIWFGAGQFSPRTPAGQQLIAHEAVHVAQQMRSCRAMVQRQPAGQSSGIVQMPAEHITSTLNPVETAVSGLSNLTGAGVTASTPTISRPQADIERNSPQASTPLPFTPSGWDGTDILTRLGQYDRIAGTDSDAIRCVQAVGMAAHIPDGPDAVVNYLGTLAMQGMMGAQQDQRKRTALRVLEYVKSRIEMRHATFGDLSWAQEAMHDLFYDDVSGTPLGDIAGQVAPAMDLTKSMQSMDVWCNSPQDVMAQANQLNPGEQLLIEEWSVMVNAAFDDLEEQGIHVAEGDSTVVEVNGQRRRIRRIAPGQRPTPTDLDFNRDFRSGHQLLIIKDASTSALRLYEPELTGSGRHFDGLAADGSNLVSYFGDQPGIGFYRYIEIIGKLTRGMAAPAATP